MTSFKIAWTTIKVIAWMIIIVSGLTLAGIFIAGSCLVAGHKMHHQIDKSGQIDKGRR